jgi:hypothetical protein
MGGEAICLLSFPLLLRLAFVIRGIAAGTQGFVDCVYCVGGAVKILISSVRIVHFFCCTIKAFHTLKHRPISTKRITEGNLEAKL